MPNAHKTDPISVRYDADLEEWLRRTAERQSVSVRSLIVEAVTDARKAQETGISFVQLVELIEVMIEAIDIPYAATTGDDEIRARILSQRMLVMLVSVKALFARDGLTRDAGWTVGFIREQLAKFPATGYRTEYAEVIAERDGITIEEARAKMTGIGAELLNGAGR